MAAAPFLGIVAAEIGLLAIWAALGPQRWTVRLLLTLTYALLLYTTVIMGLTVALTFSELAVSLESGIAKFYLFLPIVLLAAQLPLWILRIAAGCRIVRADPENGLRPTGSRQFQLLDLFGALTVLAVALGLASLGLPLEEPADDITWPIVLIICCVCAGWSTFSTLPCLWAGLVARNTALSTVLIAIYVLVITSVLLTIATAIAGSAPPDEAYFAFLLLFAALLGVMLAVLHVVRSWGYVLRGAGRRKSVSPLSSGGTDTGPAEDASQRDDEHPGARGTP